MNKFLAVLTVGLIAGSAVADIAPPPPPKGKKYADVSNEVKLDKDVSGYVFVTQVSTFPNRGATFAKPELSATKATAMPAGARRTFVELIAVPQDAAKEFKTDAELFDALKDNKVKGVHRIGFNNTATVADTVKDKAVKWTHTVTAVNPKDGIKTKVEGEGYEPPAAKKKEPLAQGGSWMAGIAAALALALGGFWLVGRTRRKA